MFADICIMRILLIAATGKEIQQTSSYCEEKKNKKGDIEIEIKVTGVGMVATAYFLGKNIYEFRPNLIIQAGIAGCFQKDKNSSVVSISEDLIADMGAYEKDSFKNIFDLGLAKKNEYPFTNGSLINPYQKLIALSNCKPAKAITVNEVSTDPNRIQYYQQNHDPYVETMEGAALHYVCLHENIPFIQIRSVSNYIGERDKSKWEIREAITNLNTELILFINKLADYNETDSWI